MTPEFLEPALVAVSTWHAETWLLIAQVVFGPGGLAQCAVVAVYLWQQGKYHRERMRILDEREAAWGLGSDGLDESPRRPEESYRRLDEVYRRLDEVNRELGQALEESRRRP